MVALRGVSTKWYGTLKSKSGQAHGGTHPYERKHVEVALLGVGRLAEDARARLLE